MRIMQPNITCTVHRTPCLGVYAEDQILSERLYCSVMTADALQKCLSDQRAMGSKCSLAYEDNIKIGNNSIEPLAQTFHFVRGTRYLVAVLNYV